MRTFTCAQTPNMEHYTADNAIDLAILWLK